MGEGNHELRAPDTGIKEPAQGQDAPVWRKKQAGMYETRREAPLSRRLFLRRLLVHLLAAAGLLTVSLGVGMAGYMGFEHLDRVDAFINTAMLLGGMGPVDVPKTHAGKLFAGGYALYAGLVFIVTAALVCTPVLHRLMHRFHWDDQL